MNVEPAATGEGSTSPLMLLGGSIVLIVLLLAFSSGDVDDSAKTTDGRTTIKDLRGGGGGVGAFIPGGPAPNDLQGGGRFSGGPSVDTVETVRDMMGRLPRNRNDPELYNPPIRVRTPR